MIVNKDVRIYTRALTQVTDISFASVNAPVIATNEGMVVTRLAKLVCTKNP